MSLPDDLYQLPTMDQVLTDLEPEYSCKCGRAFAPQGFVCTEGLESDLPRFVCHTCASHAFRVAKAAEAAAIEAAKAAWDTEAGLACRMDRDRRVNATLWTTADGSPLSEDCKAAWRAWRTAMHRLTLDHAEPLDPSSPLWPKEPPVEYATT